MTKYRLIFIELCFAKIKPCFSVTKSDIKKLLLDFNFLKQRLVKMELCFRKLKGNFVRIKRCLAV